MRWAVEWNGRLEGCWCGFDEVLEGGWNALRALRKKWLVRNVIVIVDDSLA